MGLFGRLGRARGRRARAGVRRGADRDGLAHLADFVATRRGVEAFVEPRTAVTETTVLLVAGDGEWTRRRVDGPSGAAAFARQQRLPLYDPATVGYPRRMREYNERMKRTRDDGAAR